MKESSLADLICPALTNGDRCHGRLSLVDGPVQDVPVMRSPSSLDEIYEALVRCDRCGIEYPVIASVLILVDSIKTYLARNYSLITSAAAGHIGRPMLQYLESGGYDLHDLGYTTNLWENALGMGLYISAHFDDLADIVGPNYPLADVVRAYCERDFYARVLDIASQALSSSSRVLDVGCNVGGMTWRLAETCKFVYGIDYSFRVALIARRILLGHPEPLGSYRLLREGSRYERRTLTPARRDNVEVLVASGLCLPFQDGTVDLAHCANVVDLVGRPEAIVEEAERVVRTQGSLLITDPYFWRTEDTPMDDWFGAKLNQPSSTALRDVLATRCDITASEDVLWILRAYDRYLTMWIVDCVLARKHIRQVGSEPKSVGRE